MISSESYYSLNIWKTHQIRSAVTPTVNQSCPMRETQGEPADGAQRSAIRSSDRMQHHKWVYRYTVPIQSLGGIIKKDALGKKEVQLHSGPVFLQPAYSSSINGFLMYIQQAEKKAVMCCSCLRI